MRDHDIRWIGRSSLTALRTGGVNRKELPWDHSSWDPEVIPTLLKKLASRTDEDVSDLGADRPIPLPRYADSAGDIHGEDGNAITQPVAVDGCGGQVPLAIKIDCSPWCVSTTAEWTAKPAAQPCPAGTGQLPEYTESRIKNDRQLKQGVKEGSKEDGIAADQNVLTAKREHQRGRPQKEKDQQTSGVT